MENFTENDMAGTENDFVGDDSDFTGADSLIVGAINDIDRADDTVDGTDDTIDGITDSIHGGTEITEGQQGPTEGTGAKNSEKRSPGLLGDSVFPLLVPRHKVGDIIGRKQEFIKTISEESQAPIKILEAPPGAPERSVECPDNRFGDQPADREYVEALHKFYNDTEAEYPDYWFGDQLADREYVEDLYKFYNDTEKSIRPHDYVYSHVGIDDAKRRLFRGILIKEHDKLKLKPETLYITFCIMDQFLAKEQVECEETCLVGLSSMLIAAKYMNIPFKIPGAIELAYSSNDLCNRGDIIKMEYHILETLEWKLPLPSPYVFLVRFMEVEEIYDEMKHMIFFFAELALLEYSWVSYRPSRVAAAAVYVARCTLKESPPWTHPLQHHTRYNEAELLECAKVLVEAHSAAGSMDAAKEVYTKYSSMELGAVALHPPAMQTLAKRIQSLQTSDGGL